MSRYFIDTEFIDDSKTIDLISIGIVSSDGREYYAQSRNFDEDAASHWVLHNVIYKLPDCKAGDMDDHRFFSLEKGCSEPGCPWRIYEQIKQEVLAFMDAEKYGTPELWGWCCAFDYVILSQLFGIMAVDWPQGWTHYIKDVQFLLDERGLTDDMLPPQEGTAHNALEDARYIRQLWEFLQTKEV